jgi:hypothetical protein
MKSLSVALLLLCSFFLVSTTEAKPTLPKDGRVIHGVNYTGNSTDFPRFKKSVRNRPDLISFYEKWGTYDTTPFRVWQKTNTKALISVSTGQSHDARRSRISLREIAKGKGDRYILWLNEHVSKRGNKPTYIVLFPEMNGYWNPYSTYSKNGQLRSSGYTPKWFIRAYRRFALIVRGGSVDKLNRKLTKANLRPLRKTKREHLPRPKVDMAWIPQERGAPDFPGNGPEAYWPGSRYVDWVGINTFSRWPKFHWLDWFYEHEQWDNKPIMIGEYAVAKDDYPAWVEELFNWVRTKRRVQMMTYYQGFRCRCDGYRINHYPLSKRELRRQFNMPIIQGPAFPKEKPKSAPKAKKKTNPKKGSSPQKDRPEAPLRKVNVAEPESLEQASSALFPWWLLVGAGASGLGYGFYRYRR